MSDNLTASYTPMCCCYADYRGSRKVVSGVQTKPLKGLNFIRGTAQTADTACLWHWTDAGRFPKFRHLPQPQGKIKEELKSCCKLPSTLFKYPTTRQYKIFNLLYIVSTLVVKFQRTCSFLTVLIFLNFQIAEPPDVSRRRSFTKRRRVQSRRRQRARRWRNSSLNNGQ